MAIVLMCDCGRKLQIKDELAGQERKCPACGRTLQIPYPNEPSAKLPPGTSRVVEAAPVQAAAPPAPIQNHGGDPLPQDVDFFVEPPAEIGPVTSAYSTLRLGKEPWPLLLRVFLSAALAGFGVFVSVAIVSLNRVHNPFWVAAWPLALGGIGAALGLFTSRFTHTCT